MDKIILLWIWHFLHVEYGCSLVAKLSWEKMFFLKKIFVFLTKYTLFAEKKIYMEKKFHNEKFFYWKKRFYTGKCNWKCKNYISHFRNILLHRKCLCFRWNINLS